MKKILPIFIAAIIIVGGGAFYGGTKYAESKSPAGLQGMGGNFTNLSPEERQARMEQFGANGPRGNRSGGFVSGEILSKDDKSITVKLPDGGSKIVFFSGSTKISKSVEGTAGDLTVGQDVVVSGTANQDGSVSAGTIEARPKVSGAGESPASKQ